MESTLAIILKAQDQMSSAFKAATGAAVGLDTATTEAGDALQTAGAQADKNATQTGEATAASRAFSAALEKMTDSTAHSTAGVKKLEGGLQQADQKQQAAAKSGEGLATKLDHMMGIAEKVGQALSMAFGAAAASMARAAEQGDKASESILGQFGQMQRAGDGIGAAFAQTLAPALHPVTKGIEDMSRSMADWIKTNQIGKTIIVAAIQQLLDLATAAQIVRDEYEKWKASIQSVRDKIISTQNDAAKSAIGWLSGHTERIDKYQANIERIRGEFAKLQAQVDKGVALKGDDLLSYQQFGAVLAQVSQNDFGKKIVDQNKPGIKETSSALDDLRARLLKMMGDAKNASDTDFSFIGDPKKAKEARDKMNDEVSASLGDLSAEIAAIVDGMIEKDQQYLDAADAAAMKAEEISQRKADDLRALAEMRVKDTDEAVAAIDFQSISEEAAAQKKIALYQLLAQASVENAEIQKAAQTKAIQEQIKLGELMASKWKETAHASASAFTGMLDIMLKGGTTLKEKLKAVFSQVTDMMLANFQKQQDAAIEAANKSVAAGEAGSVREALAAQKGIIPKILSAAASLPFPASAIVAGLAMAAFKALMNKAASFFEYGGPVESGSVGGFGRRDSVSAQLTPGEFVLRPEAVRSIGQDTLDRANQTGELPSGGGGAMTLNARFVIEAGRGVVLMPQQVAQEVGPYIADTLNSWVKNHGGILYASDLLVSLPQPAGA